MHRQGEGSALTSERKRKIRARVIGIGLDDAGGHLRFTSGGDILLFGGSDATHGEMQRRALRLREELGRLGISLDGMTAEQGAALAGIVERVNHPEAG